MGGFPKLHVNNTIKLYQFNQSSISFSEELKDFSMTDFVKEILNRFGLTMFPDEFSNKIKYKTISERINTAKKIDWSSKFIERKSESYVFESYAQQNTFQFSYNDKEGSYQDASIIISNQNISESKTVFKSKTYAPEKLKTVFNLNSTESFESDVLKVHEKEVNEKNGTNEVKYKALSKRFFFVFAVQDNKTIDIGSEVLNETQQISSFYRAVFAGSWNNLLKKFYSEFSKIINESRIHDIDLNLNDVDVLQLELDALYYFSQEQQWYFLNKLTADEKTQSGEFVRVKPFDIDTVITEPTIPPDDDITLIEWNSGGIVDKSGSDTSIDVKLTSIKSTLIPDILSKDWQVWDGNNFISQNTDTTPFTMSTPMVGANRIRMRIKMTDGSSVYSNVLIYNRANYYVCKKYSSSKYIGSGDDLYVYWKDCNYNDQSWYAMGSGVGQWISPEFCASEGTLTSNGDIQEIGLC